WIWKENGWERVVAIETVRNVLNRHGLWKNGKKKKKRKNKGTTADSPNKTSNIDEIARKANIKQVEEELRAWKRKIRIERKKEDKEWGEYREKRIKLKKRWGEMSKAERKRFRKEKKRNDGEWVRKKAERRELKAKRDEDDEKWRNMRKEVKEKMNVAITSLVAILVIIDNCTRRCLGLPVFIKGRKVTADDVIRALENRLPPELRYILSDNGKQFIAEAFQRLCTNKGIVHVRITRPRPATNGIADCEASLVKLSLERFFAERLKEMLAEREWKDVEELVMVLEEVISTYNDAPHQGLDGLSPDEYGRRFMCVASG
ncbi:MAG: DDE-type integrase/transposase/recombinase, partial [Halobacteriota archaeon]